MPNYRSLPEQCKHKTIINLSQIKLLIVVAVMGGAYFYTILINKNYKIMGLSIKIYQNYSETTDEENYDFEAYVIDEDWKDRIKNLKSGGLYTAEKKTRTISYSCTYHNDFRRLLCEMLGYGKDEWLGGTKKINSETPFYEFFEFSDNEGCMDFETSKELHNDFSHYKTKFFELYKDLGDYVLDQYDLWLETFDLGKDNGVVVFW